MEISIDKENPNHLVVNATVHEIIKFANNLKYFINDKNVTNMDAFKDEKICIILEKVKS